MTGCDVFRPELGALVLGGLDPDDAVAVEAHLAACPDCRAEHADIAGVPALLDLARTAPPQVPARVRDRVVAEASRRRGRTRWFAVAAGIAVVATLSGGLAGWLLAPSEVRMAVPLEGVEPYEATGWATFWVEGERMVVELEVSALDVLAEPGVYEAWVSTHDDGVHSIGRLDTGAGGSVSVTLTADGGPDAYRAIWITAEPDRRDPAHEGPTVLRAPVPAQPGATG